VMNTSATSALSEASERALGEEMACRKNSGRNTALSAWSPFAEVLRAYVSQKLDPSGPWQRL
jgi:hypothetical protein